MDNFFRNPPKIRSPAERRRAAARGKQTANRPAASNLRPGMSKLQAEKVISEMLEEDMDMKTTKLESFSKQYQISVILCVALVIGYMYNIIKDENKLVESHENVSEAKMVDKVESSWKNGFGLINFINKKFEESYNRSHIRINYNNHPVGSPVIFGNIEGFPVLIYRLTNTPIEEAVYGKDFIVNMCRDPHEGTALVPVLMSDVEPSILDEQLGVRKPEHPHLPFVLYSFPNEKIYTLDNAPEYKDNTYKERVFKRPIILHPLFYQVTAKDGSLTLTKGSFIKNNFAEKSFEHQTSGDRTLINSWDKDDIFIKVKPSQTIVERSES